MKSPFEVGTFLRYVGPGKKYMFLSDQTKEEIYSKGSIVAVVENTNFDYNKTNSHNDVNLPLQEGENYSLCVNGRGRAIYIYPSDKSNWEIVQTYGQLAPAERRYAPHLFELEANVIHLSETMKAFLADYKECVEIKKSRNMNLQEKINENTILYYVEDNNSHYDENGNLVITVFSLSFGFYDCQYFVFVTAKDIEQDFASVCLDGDSKLHDSFENACENEHWELIKKKCADYVKYRAELEAEFQS
jgi:hypothetical protein